MQFTFFHASGREGATTVKPNEMGVKKTRQHPSGEPTEKISKIWVGSISKSMKYYKLNEIRWKPQQCRMKM